MNLKEVKQLLEKYNAGALKKYGQNFLIDDHILKTIASSLGERNEYVIEVGPGGGALTELMVPKSGHALLYEADGRLESHLKELLKDNNNYDIVIGDFLKANLSEDLNRYSFDKFYLVVLSFHDRQR